MKFIIENSLKQFARSFKFYLFIMIELVLCLSICAIGLNSFFSAQTRKKELLHNSMKAPYFINATTKVGGDLDLVQSLPFSVEDYRLLKENFGEFYEFAYLEIGEDLQIGGTYIPYVRLNPEYLKVLDVRWDGKSKFLIGEAVTKELRNEIGHYLSERNPARGLSHELEYWEIDRIVSSMGFINSDIPLDYIVVEVVNEAATEPVSTKLVRSEMRFSPKVEIQEDRLLFNEIGSLLKERNGDSLWEYEVKRQDELFEPTLRRVQEEMRVSLLIGLFIVILVTVGFCGAVLVRLYSRRKNYAIVVLLGAQEEEIALELLFELMLVTFIPTVLALLISFIYSSFQSNLFYEVKVNSWTILITVAIALLCMLFAWGIALVLKGKESALEILSTK